MASEVSEWIVSEGATWESGTFGVPERNFRVKHNSQNLITEKSLYDLLRSHAALVAACRAVVEARDLGGLENAIEAAVAALALAGVDNTGEPKC